LSTLVVLAGGAGRLGCIGEGRKAALAELLRRAREEIEAELMSLQSDEEPAAVIA
jgi:hypothetical protein